MATVTRVKGSVLPKLTLKIGSAAAVDFSEQLIGVEVTDGDGEEALTFADFASGVAPLAINLTSVFSYDAGALYKFLWENSGLTGVAFVYNRWGLAAPTAAKPNLVGTVQLPPKTGWSAEAGNDSDQFESTLQIEGTPTWATS